MNNRVLEYNPMKDGYPVIYYIYLSTQDKGKPICKAIEDFTPEILKELQNELCDNRMICDKVYTVQDIEKIESSPLFAGWWDEKQILRLKNGNINILINNLH